MFIEQAYKGDNIWWKVLITTFLSTGIFVLNIIVYLLLSKEQLQLIYDAMNNTSKIIGLINALVPFAFLLGLLFLLVIYLHQRNITTLTTSRSKIDIKRIFFSFGLIIFFAIASFIISYCIDHSNIELNFNFKKFSILFFVCLVLLPFQIGFEEYLFRGYLMQQIGIIAKNRWIPLLITSISFGIFHSANPEVAELGFGVMFFYIGTGLLLGIMTLMDEGIELALGFHFGNNLIAALLITSDYSALQTDAIFKYSTKENNSNILIEMIILLAIIYPIIIFILAKKYNWINWKEKLSGKIKNTI